MPPAKDVLYTYTRHMHNTQDQARLFKQFFFFFRSSFYTTELLPAADAKLPLPSDLRILVKIAL